jgi:hypothetical protein
MQIASRDEDGVIRVFDASRGLEIHLSQSQIRPDATNVTVFGKDEFDVRNVILDLADEWANTSFIDPVRCPSGWGAMGRVWGPRIGSPPIGGAG